MAGNVVGQEVYMVTWFFEDLMSLNFGNIYNQLVESLKNFTLVFFKYYNFLIIFIILGFFNFIRSKNNEIKKNLLFLAFLIFGLSFIQFFMSKKSTGHMYMGSDYFLLSLFFVLYYLKKIEPKKFVVTIILIFVFLINIINLPYVSPYDQTKVVWQKKFKPNSKSLKYFD